MGAIKTALDGSAKTGEEPKWGEILSEFMAITRSPTTPETVALLMEIVGFSGELQLDERSPMPHRMSPERMLKWLAQKELLKWAK